VGVVTDYVPGNCFEFDDLVRYRVAKDGSWSTTYMSYRDYFRRSWDDVWAGHTTSIGFDSLNMKAWPGHDPLKILDMLPKQLVDIIMGDSLWDTSMCQWTVT
jgi:hypothetical protein